MPIILSKIYNIDGNYTQEEKAMYEDLIDAVRLRISDDEPLKNILNKHQEKLSDGEIIRLANETARDINSGTPRTKYQLKYIYEKDSELVVLGIIIFWFIV